VSNVCFKKFANILFYFIFLNKYFGNILEIAFARTSPWRFPNSPADFHGNVAGEALPHQECAHPRPASCSDAERSWENGVWEQAAEGRGDLLKKASGRFPSAGPARFCEAAYGSSRGDNKKTVGAWWPGKSRRGCPFPGNDRVGAAAFFKKKKGSPLSRQPLGMSLGGSGQPS
jgi:hypothetical protein